MRLRNWNEKAINTLLSINWRASLVPAAAVTPAPKAYIKIAAVKKLVVEAWYLTGINSVCFKTCIVSSRVHHGRLSVVFLIEYFGWPSCSL